jgi:hypothetical protein
MAVDRNGKSLIALDAIVLDTETTGPDPRTARVVEMAAARLVSGRLDTGAPFRRPRGWPASRVWCRNRKANSIALSRRRAFFSI